MSGQAGQRLAKAGEFLAGAQACLAAGLPNPATSCAVTAGILANDAICLARLGRYSAGRSHQEAVLLARQAGPSGRRAATILIRLLSVKEKAQYAADTVTAGSAGSAVDQARRLVDLARIEVAG